MRTPASIAHHPIHPMLVPIPIGLWIFSLVCDLIFVFGSGASVWASVAFYCMAGGIVGALVAALPGFIDMLSLSGDPKKIALGHMAINLTVVVLYAINLWLRINGGSTVSTIGLSVIAIGLLAVSGWLGGHMVFVHGVAVDTDKVSASAPRR